MSSGNSVAKPELTLEARKHLLLVACTLDRISLVAKLRPPASPLLAWGNHVSLLPWLETATSIAERLLPQKLRLLISVWRSWRRARRRR